MRGCLRGLLPLAGDARPRTHTGLDVRSLSTSRAVAPLLELVVAKVIAYTLGNPEVYDQALVDRPVHKIPGGVAYKTLEEARAVLDAKPAGFLPPEWFKGRWIPGAVYELELPGPFHYHTRWTGERHALTCPARVIGRAPEAAKEESR